MTPLPVCRQCGEKSDNPICMRCERAGNTSRGNAYDVLDGLEPKAVVGNTGEGFDDPALGFAVAASLAISLKRIADRLDSLDLTPLGNQLLDIAYQAGVNFRGNAK